MNVPARESDPGTLSIRLLALLEKISRHAAKQDVHRLRTTVRRLEVHLAHPPARIAKTLKKLRKKAGKARDIDVHLDLLKPALLPAGRHKVPAATSPRPRPQEKLRDILQSQRDSQRGGLRQLVKQCTPLLESRLPGLIESHRETAVSTQDAQQMARRARQRFLQLTKRIPEDEERLHRLRIETKRLRYRLEPLEFCPEAMALAERFKQVQDAIGEWHDWATLAQLAERRLHSPAAAPVIQGLKARAGREYRRARRSTQSARSWMMQTPASAPAPGPRLVRKAG